MTVDAGALLFKHNTPPAPAQRKQEEIQAKGIVDAYNLMNYDAVGISAYDLAAGLQFFRKIAAQSHFPWLSADIVAKADGRPLFTPQIIVEKQGMKIGIIALTGSRAQTLPADAEAKITDWHEILPQIVAELEDKCDLLILLSSLSDRENKEITRTVPAINLLIQAGTRTANMKPALLNKTLACRTGKQGKYLGELVIKWDKKKIWSQDVKIKLLNQRRNLDRINWQLKRLSAKGDPAEVDKQKPGTLQKYNFLAGKKQALENKIKALKEQAADHEQNSTWKNQFIAMQVSMPDQAEILKIVNETKRRVNAAGKQQARGIKMIKSYAGSRACRSCHKKQYDNWQASRHGRAYRTLEEKKQQYNLNCIYCHVTGLNRDNAPVALSLNENMRNVGCESCHGPGKQHLLDPSKQKMILRPTSQTCQSCHRDEHDDSFVYKEALSRLSCGAEGR